MDIGKGGEVDGIGLAPLQRLAGSGELSRDDTIQDGRHLGDNRLRVGPRRQRDIAITILGMPAEFRALAVPVRNRRVWQEHVAIKLRIVGYVPHDACYLQGDHSAKAGGIGGLAIGRGCDDLSDDIGGAEIFSRRAFRKNQRLGVPEDTAGSPCISGSLMIWKKSGSTAVTCSRNCRSPTISVMVLGLKRVIPVTSGISSRIAAGIGNGTTAMASGSRPGNVDRHLNPIEVLRIGDPFVVGQFIPDEQEHEDHAGQPDRQAAMLMKL